MKHQSELLDRLVGKDIMNPAEGQWGCFTDLCLQFIWFNQTSKVVCSHFLLQITCSCSVSISVTSFLSLLFSSLLLFLLLWCTFHSFGPEQWLFFLMCCDLVGNFLSVRLDLGLKEQQNTDIWFWKCASQVTTDPGQESFMPFPMELVKTDLFLLAVNNQTYSPNCIILEQLFWFPLVLVVFAHGYGYQIKSKVSFHGHSELPSYIITDLSIFRNICCYLLLLPPFPLLSLLSSVFALPSSFSLSSFSITRRQMACLFMDLDFPGTCELSSFCMFQKQHAILRKGSQCYWLILKKDRWESADFWSS